MALSQLQRLRLEVGPSFVPNSPLTLMLRNKAATEAFFLENKPAFVIHTAAIVGGLFKNMNDNLGMYQGNMDINRNVLEACHKSGVKKLVSVLSTCIFPDAIESYPFDEKVIHMGPPHFSNEGYAYAKRMLDVETRLYRQQFGVDYVCAIPTNIFGPFDNFHLGDAHVVPALIHNTSIAQANGTPLTVLGSGSPLRQFVYSVDIGRVLAWMLFNYSDPEPMIIAPEQEISIKDLAHAVIEAWKEPVEIKVSPRNDQPL